eukprot:14910-Pelagococcus_subviridis.AAC.1
MSRPIRDDCFSSVAHRSTHSVQSRTAPIADANPCLNSSALSLLSNPGTAVSARKYRSAFPSARSSPSYALTRTHSSAVGKNRIIPATLSASNAAASMDCTARAIASTSGFIFDSMISMFDPRLRSRRVITGARLPGPVGFVTSAVGPLSSPPPAAVFAAAVRAFD